MLQVAQERVQLKAASSDSTDAQHLIEKHFPVLVFQCKPGRVYLSLGFYALLFFGLSAGLFFAFHEVPVKIASVLFAGFGVYLMREYWLAWKDQTLTLTVDSIQLKSWKMPLLFKDIKTMQVFSQNGTQSLKIFLNENRGPFAKRPLYPWPRKNYSIDLSSFSPNADAVVAQVHRYFAREI